MAVRGELVVVVVEAVRGGGSGGVAGAILFKVSR